jgi:hypothetical protein
MSMVMIFAKIVFLGQSTYITQTSVIGTDFLHYVFIDPWVFIKFLSVSYGQLVDIGRVEGVMVTNFMHSED